MKRLLFFIAGFLSLAVLFPLSASADVNDFLITEYDIVYVLGKSAEGRSTLKTVETITATFPAYDQNHGIERAIPTEYDGHKTKLKITSVKNEQGRAWNYTTYNQNGNTVVRIGDADRYVHGQQTYVISYEQQDVTRYFPDTGRDEFYWDTNGTDWQVPITALTVRLTVDPSLAGALTGDTACYQGIRGSNAGCKITQNENAFIVQEGPLSYGENVTVAVGFKPGTFAAYEPSIFERVANFALLSSLLGIPVAAIALAALGLRYSAIASRKKERKTVVNEFLPPKDISITSAATLVTAGKSVFTAQLLDLAVRGYIKIYQTREKRLFRSAEYDIEVTKDVSTLRDEEREILSDIFGGVPTAGQRLALKSLKNNTTVYNRMQNNDKALKKLVRGQYGLREKVPVQSGWFKKAALWSFALSVLLLCAPLLIVSVVALIMSYTLWVLTDKGLGLARYLDGLRHYISVAEVDRLKAMQSPEGAQKLGGIDPADTAQVVKLYEKVLPYAVLFGQEKAWNEQLGKYYESIGQSPSWYHGHSAFNAATFSSGMNSFGTAASYTSASNSSSGGSSGGGSSGGGGGGGGGGGW